MPDPSIVRGAARDTFRGRPRTLLVAAAAALVAATAPADTALAASAADSTSTVVVTVVATVPARAGTAATDAKGAVNPFSCWAAPLIATAAGTPTGTRQACATDQVGGQQGPQTVGGVRVQVVDAVGSTARTGGLALTSQEADTTQGANADASAKSTRLVVKGNVVEIGMTTSDSKISCTYSASGARYSFVSRSTVHGVKINGRPVRLHDGTMDIPVAGSTLRLNASQLSKIGNVQQAATLLTKTATVVVSETAVALSQVSGNPCLP
jgi:hypothetical protein